MLLTETFWRIHRASCLFSGHVQVSWSPLNCFVIVCLPVCVCCMYVVYVRDYVRAAPYNHTFGEQ